MRDLKMDSLDVIDVGFELEDEFSIEIPDKTITEVQTVQDIIDAIAVSFLLFARFL